MPFRFGLAEQLVRVLAQLGVLHFPLLAGDEVADLGVVLGDRRILAGELFDHLSGTGLAGRDGVEHGTLLGDGMGAGLIESLNP